MIKNKQEDLENLCQFLIAQNNQMLNENKILWTKLLKNKEKNEKRLEKLYMIILT